MAGELSAFDVLLVEDNPGDARLIEHYLSSPDVEQFVDVTLTTEDNLTDGRETLAAERFDVVLLDLGLPESSGLETLDRVLSDDPGIPIIVLTGFDDHEAAVTAIKRGAQDFLPKGDLDSDQLVRALRYAVERHEQEMELQRQTERMEFFNSILQHDMLNGMNVIHGHGNQLAEELDGTQGDSAETIVRWSDNIIELTRKIRSILDTVTDDGSVDLVPVNLASVIEEEVERVSGMDGVEHIEVDAPDSAEVAADDLLSDIVGNLLTNAVEHTDNDVTITIEVEQRVDAVLLTVADDGGGLGGDYESVFERGATGTQSTGSGFGLYFVDSMMESYGGDISARASDTAGAAFVAEFEPADSVR
jgi:signal transduction histidine kinase